MTDRIQQLRERMALQPPDSVDFVDEAIELMQMLGSERPAEAVKLARDTRPVAERLGYKEGVAQCFMSEGFALYLLSDHDRAYPVLSKALSLFEELGDRRGIGRAKGTLASVHISQGDYGLAFEEAFDALNIVRDVGDRRMEAWMLQGLGAGYGDLGDHDSALRYCREALDAFRALEFPLGVARSLNGIGTVHQNMEKYEEARRYHSESLDIFRSIDNKLGEARALNDLGVIHQRLGEYQDALACHEKALELRHTVGNKQAKSTSLINIGLVHIDLKAPDKAMDSLHRALTIAMEIRAKPRVYQANLALSEAHALIGDYESALTHYKIYQQVKEEVVGDQAASRIRNLQIGFETEKSKREAEISRLKNVELREKNEQLEELLRELKQAETKIIQQEKMAALGKLVAGIVHELNTPLGAIHSASDTATRSIVNLIDGLESAESLEELRANHKVARAMDALRTNARLSREAVARINRIVKSLKSFTRLDEASFQRLNIHDGLDATLTLMEHDLGERIEVVRAYGDDVPEVEGYPGELNQLFMNLLTNARQAIEGAGVVTVRTRYNNGYVRIEISDTGVGIPREQLVNIFEPGLSRHGRRVKAGIGLFTAYNIVQKHAGNIEVMSEEGGGTTVTVILPTDSARGATG